MVERRRFPRFPFGNLPDDELADELSRRGLEGEFDFPAEPADEPDDDFDEDEDGEIRLLRREAVGAD